jgi:hypothetical protein
MSCKSHFFWAETLEPVRISFTWSEIRSHFIALLMEAASASEKPVNYYKTTRRSNSEHRHLHTRRRENLKSCPHNISTRWRVTDGFRTERVRYCEFSSVSHVLQLQMWGRGNFFPWEGGETKLCKAIWKEKFGNVENYTDFLRFTLGS